MKVLHVLSSNIYSGAENVACQIIQMFDNEIEMAYCSPEGQIFQSLKDLGVNYLPLKKLSLKELKKVVVEFCPDIIHAHDLRACGVVACFKGVKKVAHIHVNHPQMRKISMRSVLAKMILKKFDEIFWVSSSCLDDFVFNKHFRNDNSVILPNIISLDKLKERADSAELQQGYDIVYCGRICQQKDPLRLIDVCKDLVDKNNNISIGIIGSGDMFDLVKQKVAEYNIQSNVNLLGFVSNPLGIIKNSKLMIMTSLFEGTPMTALESMGLSVPIVSTKTDGMKMLICNDINGYLYDTNEECVDYISNLIQDKKRLKKLKDTTLSFAYQYNDINIYKGKIQNAYKGV